MVTASPHCLQLLAQSTFSALVLALASAGNKSPAARRARSKSQSPCERGWCSQPFELPFGPETRRRVEHFLCPTFDTFYEVLTHASKPPSFRTYSSAEKYPALALEKLRDDFAV